MLYKPNDNNEERFHKSIAFIIVLGQFFALMPLHGVTGETERSINFTWKSWKLLYTVLIVIGSLFCVYASFLGAVRQNTDISLITASMFYGASCVVQMLFVILAKNWSKLIRKWTAIDVGMRSYGYPSRLNARLKILSAVVLTCATAEHVLVIVKNIITASECLSVEFFECYFKFVSYPQVFTIAKYSIWAGFMVQIVTTVATFSWSYIDLFIMLLSTSLALRFKQVSKRVEFYVNTSVFYIVLWRNVREDYNKLGKLCKALNDNLSYIVLVSFGSNLYFILVQFFHSLRPKGDALDKGYFFYSFGFLIGRTICVSLYGSWIHDESQKPLSFLNSVPSSMYNVEIRRFILHVGIETISLTGKRFFNVTRSIILSVSDEMCEEIDIWKKEREYTYMEVRKDDDSDHQSLEVILN
ncbi:hypothetical protein FQR65_LT17248 [Abscondita terminalis]|nr:hypothetical protein FQR65_LT17248 [Abscondita terminalis]